MVREQVGHPIWGSYAELLLDPEARLWRNPSNGGHDDKAHPPIHPTKLSTGEPGWTEDHKVRNNSICHLEADAMYICFLLVDLTSIFLNCLLLSFLVIFVFPIQRLYEFVVRHFLACVSQPAVGAGTTVEIDIAGEKFSASGLVIIAVSNLFLNFIILVKEELLMSNYVCA